MLDKELTRADAAGVPALGVSRAKVLAVLQDAAGPLRVEDVAHKVRLHTNTARFHLDALVEAGLVRRGTEPRDVPGRPRALYSAVPDAARVGRRSYRLLAEILTSYLAAQPEGSASAARDAGRAWGRYLSDRPPPFHQVSAAEATERLSRTLDEIGFAPEVADGGATMLLHHCPFREVAEAHTDIVCAVHLGLMQGLLSEMDAPVTADDLAAFVQPTLCVAQLTASPARR